MTILANLRLYPKKSIEHLSEECKDRIIKVYNYRIAINRIYQIAII